METTDAAKNEHQRKVTPPSPDNSMVISIYNDDRNLLLLLHEGKYLVKYIPIKCAPMGLRVALRATGLP